MQNGCLNVVIDAFWGSSGKGKVCDWLAATRGVTDSITSNMPNAGHTVVRDGVKRVLKVLPSASPFNKHMKTWISASSGFYHERLFEEAGWLDKRPIHINERAFSVNEHHAEAERNQLSRVSSTMQGSAAALCDKLMRKRDKTIHDMSNLPGNADILPSAKWRASLVSNIVSGTALFEVSQGWGLSIDHGTQYPFCTSRNCNVQAALSDAACPPQLIGDVIAVVRPYPIRVGNTTDGYSGDWMPDCAEVSWEHVKKVSGLEDELSEKERTTVTKRVRRVSTFSFDLLEDCCKHNGVTGIFLNFAQYIESSVSGKRGRISQAPKSVRIFADAIEQRIGVPVIALGTGADTFDVLE